MQWLRDGLAMDDDGKRETARRVRTTLKMGAICNTTAYWAGRVRADDQSGRDKLWHLSSLGGAWRFSVAGTYTERARCTYHSPRL